MFGITSMRILDLFQYSECEQTDRFEVKIGHEPNTENMFNGAAKNILLKT